MVDHLLHATLTKCHKLSGHAEVYLGDINCQAFHWLLQLSIDHLHNHLWLSDSQFETFAAHDFNKDGEL